MKPQLDICLSPLLLELHELRGKTAVIVDIFRATSCMVAGLGSGVSEIVPVSTIEECLIWKAKGYLAAGERNGIKVKRFDLGNSPLGFITPEVKGEKIVMTTTNGTRALNLSAEAEEIVVGAFLNLSTVVEYLAKQQRDTVLVCAGWRGNVNMEDTLFAGAVADALQNHFTTQTDAVRVALALYEQSKKTSLRAFLETAAHYQRLVRRSKTVEQDLIFNLTVNKFNVLPYLSENRLILK